RLPARAPAGADTTQAASGGRVSLSERQLEVLALLMQGKPNKVIARELDVSEGTVKMHLAIIFGTLQARNRTEAVAAAQRLGLLSL
ncbi:MAG: response regulator transcription factor, partial [Pseudomonadota bacterium]|nr:response regulator transcription factor [Pseudomonadota bacterium]